MIEEMRHPGPLIAEGPRRVTKLVLFPVRFLYTAATGEVGTNDAAVAHYLEQSGAPGAAAGGSGSPVAQPWLDR